jgi:hypothetical protein
VTGSHDLHAVPILKQADFEMAVFVSCIFEAGLGMALLVTNRIENFVLV